jgi:hypothetical protein
MLPSCCVMLGSRLLTSTRRRAGESRLLTSPSPTRTRIDIQCPRRLASNGLVSETSLLTSLHGVSRPACTSLLTSQYATQAWSAGYYWTPVDEPRAPHAHVPRLVLLLLVVLMVVVLLLLVVLMVVVVLLVVVLMVVVLLVVVVVLMAACPGRPACPCRQSWPLGYGLWTTYPARPRLRAMGHISCPAWGMGYGPLTPLPIAREAGRRPRCRFR